MRNLSGLTNIQPGEVKNPKGRTKGVQNRSTLVKKWMNARSKGKNPLTASEQNLTQQDWITIAMIGQARKGNVRAAEFLFDARFGAVLRNVDPNKIPEDTANQPEDYAPFTIVDPLNGDEVISFEIGAAI